MLEQEIVLYIMWRQSVWCASTHRTLRNNNMHGSYHWIRDVHQLYPFPNTALYNIAGVYGNSVDSSHTNKGQESLTETAEQTHASQVCLPTRVRHKVHTLKKSSIGSFAKAPFYAQTHTLTGEHAVYWMRLFWNSTHSSLFAHLDRLLSSCKPTV